MKTSYLFSTSLFSTSGVGNQVVELFSTSGVGNHGVSTSGVESCPQPLGLRRESGVYRQYTMILYLWGRESGKGEVFPENATVIIEYHTFQD